MRPNEEQAKALLHLRTLPEFRTVLGMLGDYAATLNQTLIMKDDVNIDITRGELRTLAKLQHAVDSADEIVSAHNRPKQ